jgi:predicted nuclease of restriction endonuclease-like (RecB) superfamily
VFRVTRGEVLSMKLIHAPKAATYQDSVRMSSKKKPTATRKKPIVSPSATDDFDSLVSSIVQIHQQSQAFATKAVNVGLTLRNWFIGHRIVEFEQKGADRAGYGENLMTTLSQRLAACGLPQVTPRELRRYRQLYQVYPQIWQSVTAKSLEASGLTAMLPFAHSVPSPIRESVTAKSQNGETLSPEFIHRLSFTHLSELIQLPDDTQRRFYEIECIRGNWSIRELRRQIASLYYERSGLSKDKAKLSALAHAAADTLQPAHIIRDPYVFEFLGLRSRDVMAESDLEDALLDRLQDFLLELGHGFCFEARQKRILIGDDHFFIDLVFYHRVLKCHVLVELKSDAFRHEHLGQLNTYVAYYKKHQMTAGDQSPIGILLCTRKNDALVEFALGDLSNKVFVSRYAVELPKKEEMERFIAQLGKEVAQ